MQLFLVLAVCCVVWVLFLLSNTSGVPADLPVALTTVHCDDTPILSLWRHLTGESVGFSACGLKWSNCLF